MVGVIRGFAPVTFQRVTSVPFAFPHRLAHPAENSLRFAAALTSIKVENDGPFRGTVEDVLKRQEMA